jgi:dTDP-4-amino-4,6-dideoxygalactose transaminase
MITSCDLAILGGEPVRRAAFVVGPMIDHEEEEGVVKAIREQNLSRYIGSDSPDIEEILRMSSQDATRINVPWHFLGGPNVRSFAADFAAKAEVKYAIPVNSATSGIATALAAAGIGPGDEVIVPGLSFSATAMAILLFNSIPVFVDVDPQTFCIDVKEIEKAITPHTRAILPVHLLGNVCDMQNILRIAERHNLKVIEDCAQAPGSKWRGQWVGTLGDAGIFSFQQSKNITTGEGGMIITNNSEIAYKCRLISNHGEVVMKETASDQQLTNVVGCNFRMTELSAAVGVAQLRKLDKVNAWRNRNAQFLVQELADVPGFTPPCIHPEVEWACHVLAFLYDGDQFGIPRELFLAALRAEGIPVGTGYVRAIYENPLFLRRIAFGSNGSPWKEAGSSRTYSRNQCPVITRLLNEQFLWFYHVAYPSTLDDMKDIVTAVKKVHASVAEIRQHSDIILAHGDTNKRQGRL